MKERKVVAEREMRELPIIFDGESVRGILDGRKTQTRRVLEVKDNDPFYDAPSVIQCHEVFGERQTWYGFFSHDANYKSPYGRPGDLLYVREAFAVLNDEDGRGDYVEWRAETDAPYPGQWPAEEARGNPDAPKWKPSIYMPKKMARIWLRNEGVRAERLQDISEADAEAEGVEPLPSAVSSPESVFRGERFRPAFAARWNDINEKRGYGWGTDCWVWVVEFSVERVER